MSASRTMVRSLLALSVAAPALLHAQVYRCEVNGKMEYQQEPCAHSVGNATKLMAASSEKPELWTARLAHGMSVDQVKQIVPKAKPGGNDSLKNGARERLRADPLMIGDLEFVAKFYFLNDRFLRVNYSGPMGMANETNLRTFDKLAGIFQSRYGAPINRQVSNARQGLTARAEWKLREGEVWMIIVPVSSGTSFVNFGFLPNEP